MNSEGVQGAFDMFKPFMQGILEHWYIIAIVVAAILISAVISGLKQKKR